MFYTSLVVGGMMKGVMDGAKWVLMGWAVFEQIDDFLEMNSQGKWLFSHTYGIDWVFDLTIFRKHKAFI